MKPIGRKWQRVGWVLAAGLCWLVFEGVREAGLWKATQILQARSKTFPRKFTIGEGSHYSMVALGDSTIEGVGVSNPSESLPGLVAAGFAGKRVVVTNLGLSGATLRDLLDTQLSQIPTGPIDLILIGISANDVTHHTPADVFRAEFREMLEKLAASKVGKIVICTTPNYSTSPAVPYFIQRLFYRRAERLTTIIKDEASRSPNVKIADLFRKGNLPDSAFAKDGFHPNREGYAKWSAIYLDSLLN